MNLPNHINVPQQPPNQVINIQMNNFREEEVRRKRKGIGGFFRTLRSLISLIARSEGSSLAKAATLNTAKDTAKTLREQALDST